MENAQKASKSKMFRRNVKPKSNFKVEETVQIAIHKQIDKFIEDETLDMLTFPSSFTNVERGYVHTYVAKKGLKSKSTGKGADRTINIYKQKENVHTANLSLPPSARNLIDKCLKENPLTWSEKKNLQSSVNATKAANSSFRCTLTATNNISIVVPPPTRNPQADPQRQSLPIYSYRQHIIDTIDSNQVVVISGDTGSGKTTQVPQYLLESSLLRQKPCRIICTQPRRIAAISIATRVAFERGERLGDAIGYQVRLENQLSPNSNLIFTTSGFLLRCLVSGTKREIFNTTTHIILDEVHERDKFTDFLLIAIKDALTSYPNLKVILMSATIDSDIFINYFDGGCPYVNIPGRMFDVNVYHLEETLELVGYTNTNIQAFIGQMKANAAATRNNVVAAPSEQQQTNVDPDTAQYLDSVLKDCGEAETSEEAFAQFYYLVTGESVPLDFKHTETKMTALMVAAASGYLSAVKTLIQMGASCSVVDGQNRNAYAWAVQQQRLECAKFLLPFEQQKNQNQFNLSCDPRAVLLQVRLQEYLAKTNEDDIDHNILFSLISYIHKALPDGAILVFLPGYDAIVEQNDMINSYINDHEMANNVSIFMLHGNMSASDQKMVFTPADTGMRKIILSTNIAETSLTIDDVVYVIDCGKVKQKSFDAFTGATSLTSTFISQACAKQRMGRAGRVQPGICFRLYSTLRHKSLDPFTLPELLRVPLTDISLNAKFLAGDVSIAEFLGKAVQPPSPLSVSQSVKLLQKVGALDNAENVTELGALLVDLPVDVQLGKSLIYAVLLKCLDPVLTIVSALSVKDPFVLPNLDGGEAYMKTTRKTFSEDTLSDHAVLLNVYQAWSEAKANNTDRQFCRDNFISNGTMQMISGIRTQLLSHLRSINFIRQRGPGNIEDLNTNSMCWAMVKAALTAGMYPNVCRINRKLGQLSSCLVSKIMPHPSSVLRDKNPKQCQENLRALPSEWMIYGEKSRVGRFCMVRTTTLVSPLTIALMAGPIYLPDESVMFLEVDSDSDEDEDNGAANIEPKAMLKIDDWIQFDASCSDAKIVLQLRQKLSSIMLRIIQNPSLRPHEKCVNLVMQLLQNEDYDQKLPQLKNVGKNSLSVKPVFRDKSNGHMNGNRGRGGGKSFYGGRIQENWRSKEQPQQQQQQIQQNWRSNQSQQEIQPRQHYARQQSQYQSSDNGHTQYNYKHLQSKASLQHQQQRATSKNQQNRQPNTNDIVRNGDSTTVKSAPIRYFLIKATTEEQIQQLYLSGTWSMSQSVLSNLLSIQRLQAGHVEIIIFFYIPSLQEFYSVAKFLSGPLTFSFEIMQISHAKLSASNHRSMNNSDDDNTLLQTLVEYKDGAEISLVASNRLLKLFNML